MPTPHVTRVFVPANVINGKSEGLAGASADACSSVIGAPDCYELAGFLVPLCELEERGIPANVAQLAAMLVGLNSIQNVVILRHGQVWELTLKSGEGRPEIYTVIEKTSTTAPPSPSYVTPRQVSVSRLQRMPSRIRKAPARRWALGLF
jgi:hypothetical protein